jgi:hypothetical protein
LASFLLFSRLACVYFACPDATTWWFAVTAKYFRFSSSVHGKS